MARRRALVPRLLAAVSLLAALPAAAAPPLSRSTDPVVLAAAALQVLPRPHTDHLRLYRWRDGAFEPVPYQFDARDGHGDIELTRAHFALDDNDELVFMASDTGERADPSALPAASTAGVEITVEDPVDGGRGWVYLFAFDDPPPPAAVPPYAVIDADARHARSASYAVEYGDGVNVFTALHVAPAAGGTGENLLRQTRMTGEPTLRLLFADLTLHFDERTTVARIDGVKNGPVRAIRQVRLAIDLGKMFPDLPNGTTYTFHYRDGFDSPVKVSIPWMVLKTLRAFRFEDVVVFNPAVRPLRYWDGANPDGVDLADGAALRTDIDHDWWAVRSRAGSILQTLQIPERWREWGIARGTVAGDRPDPDQGDDASVAGYSLLNMTKLRAHGDYDFRQLMMVVPGGYQPGAERAARAMANQPLRTSVARIR
jgi:hypothetical protein